jgi:hypothetical protein
MARLPLLLAVVSVLDGVPNRPLKVKVPFPTLVNSSVPVVSVESIFVTMMMTLSFWSTKAIRFSPCPVALTGPAANAASASLMFIRS